jgi:hypothetical protein
MPAATLEAELLLRSARVVVDDAAAQRVQELLRHDLDWASLLRAAEAQGMTPLLYLHLNRLAPDAVPKAVLDDLRQRFFDHARHNLLLTGELLRLLPLFAGRGIRAIPFKGPTLAAYAYGNLGLRQYTDLDLLILPADLPRARDLLAAEGYHSGLHLTRGQQAAYLASIGQIPFVKDGGVCVTELHARIAPRDFHFPLGLERVWPRLRTVSINGRAVPCLAGEDLLLVLCAHGAKHCWSRLTWVCDLAEVLRVEPSMNWARIVEEARDLRCTRILQLGLVLAHDLLQAPVPVDLLQQAQRPPAIRALAAQARRRMFLQTDSGATRRGALDDALFHLRVRERLGDGVRYALSLALTPTVADWTRLRVPAPLSFLYHLMRPFRLAGKYARLVLGRGGPAPRGEGQ